MPQDHMKILRLEFSSLVILVFYLLLFCNHSSLPSQTPWNRGFTKEKSTLTRSSSNIRQFNVFNRSKHLLNTLRNSWVLVILENKNKLLFCTETQNELIWFDSSRSMVFSLRLKKPLCFTILVCAKRLLPFHNPGAKRLFILPYTTLVLFSFLWCSRF